MTVVKAELKTVAGETIKRTFRDMKELVDHVGENPGMYESLSAKVSSVKDIRQGREGTSFDRRRY